MPNYIVDGKSYFFVDELSEEEAAERVRKFFGSSGTKAEAEEGTSDYLNPEDEGTLQEIAEGVGSGLLAIPQGIAETVTTVIDLGAGTNYTDAVTRGFNKMRDDLGIDPAGALVK